MSDALDRVHEQWRRERPDLDSRGIATIGRLLRLAALIGEELDWVAKEHGLSRGEADVVLTLRRAGAPYRLDRVTLAESLLLTPTGLTGRLEQLQRNGLIALRPGDGPPREVELTTAGVELVDTLLPNTVRNREQLLSPLSDDERGSLDRLLTALLQPLETR